LGGTNSFAVDPHYLGLARGGGQPLPSALQAKMEAAFGTDFFDVRIHEGPQAARIGALAFTIGNCIYFAAGRYQPETPQGQQILGHELAHVVQQRQGRVRIPTGTGLAVVHDHALEAEADRMGQRAAAITPSLANPAIQAKAFRFGGRPCACCSPQARPVGHWATRRTIQKMEVEKPKVKAIRGLPGFYDDDLPNQLHSGTQTTVFSFFSGTDYGSAFQSSAKPTKLLLSMAEFAGVGGTIDEEKTHAEDRIPMVVSQCVAMKLNGHPIGDTLAVEIDKIFITASPCSSKWGTSSKSVGCTENLINWHQTGFNMKYTDREGAEKIVSVRLTIKELALNHLYKSSSKEGAVASHNALKELVASGAVSRVTLNHLPNFVDNATLGLKRSYP